MIAASQYIPFQLAIKLTLLSWTKMDKFLSRLQRYTQDAMGPMIWLLDQVEQEKVIDPKAGKGAIKATCTCVVSPS